MTAWCSPSPPPSRTSAIRREPRSGGSAARWADMLRSAGVAAGGRRRASAAPASPWAATRPSALTQHFGLCVRWLDHIPMGGACAASWRCAGRRGRCRPATPDIVACVAGRHQRAGHLPPDAGEVSAASRTDAAYPYGAGGAELPASRCSPTPTCGTYGVTREDFGRICVSQRANALRTPHALMRRPLTTGPVPGGPADRGPDRTCSIA